MAATHLVRAPLEVRCTPAADGRALAAHYRIRRAVFVDEQGIFVGSDVDEHDTAEGVVHVLARRGDEPVGAVRLYPLDPEWRLWKGDRLAVLPRCRTDGVGAPLVRFAVAYAGAHGGRRMVAHIQLPNVRFFTRLGWSACGDTEDYVGRTHQPMEIPLSPEGVSPGGPGRVTRPRGRAGRG